MAGDMRPTAEVVEAWRGILQVHRTLTRRFDQSLREKHDLPLEQYDVLYQLTVTGGSRTMGDLASALLMPASNCTRLVERMKGRGLVDRQVDDSDRRIIHAMLTKAGRQMQRQAGRTHLEDIQSSFGIYVDEDTALTMVKAWKAVEGEDWEQYPTSTPP